MDYSDETQAAEQAVDGLTAEENFIGGMIDGMINLGLHMNTMARVMGGSIDDADVPNALLNVVMSYCLNYPEHARYFWELSRRLGEEPPTEEVKPCKGCGKDHADMSLMDLCEQALRVLTEMFPTTLVTGEPAHA